MPVGANAAGMLRASPSRKALSALSMAALLTLSLCSATMEPRQFPNWSSSSSAAPGTLSEIVTDVGAPALAAIIRSSRDQALSDEATPIPPRKRKLFQNFFEPELLKDVRWTVSSARPGIDTLLAGSLEYDGAVTLDHVIIFFNEAAADDTELWLHELEHVRQYREKGVEGFARAYFGQWQQIEKRTHERSVAMLKYLEKMRSAKTRKLAIVSQAAPVHYQRIRTNSEPS